MCFNNQTFSFKGAAPLGDAQPPPCPPVGLPLYRGIGGEMGKEPLTH